MNNSDGNILDRLTFPENLYPALCDNVCAVSLRYDSVDIDKEEKLTLDILQNYAFMGIRMFMQGCIDKSQLDDFTGIIDRQKRLIETQKKKYLQAISDSVAKHFSWIGDNGKRVEGILNDGR